MNVIYESALAVKPLFYSYRGRVYGNIGGYKQAINDYNKAIEIYPEYEQAIGNRGVAYHGLGDLKRAIEDYRASARLGNEPSKAFLMEHGVTW